MSFQRYESRPITRLAHEITEQDSLFEAGPNRMGIRLRNGEVLHFAYHEPVFTGDFVVYLDADDIYHCRRDVFLERNVVPEDELQHDDALTAVGALTRTIRETAHMVDEALKAVI